MLQKDFLSFGQNGQNVKSLHSDFFYLRKKAAKFDVS